MIRIVIIGMLATVAMGQSKFAVLGKLSFDTKECIFLVSSLESYKTMQSLKGLMVVVIFTLYQSPKKKSCILKESKYPISKFEYFNFFLY